MQLQLKRSDFPVFVLAIAGLILFLMLYPRLYPEASIRLPVSRDRILDKGAAFVEELGYDLSESNETLTFDYDPNQMRYLNQNFRSSKTVDLLTDSVPGMYWTLHWTLRETDLRSDDQQAYGDNEDIQDIELRMDSHGHPVYFEINRRSDEDIEISSASNNTIDDLEANQLADELMRFYGGRWTFVEDIEKPGKWGIAHQYRWNRDRKIAGEVVTLEVDIEGGRVRGFQKKYTLPKTYREDKKDRTYEGISLLVMYVTLFIILMVVFVQRLRSDRLDLKNGLIPGILALIGWSINFWAETIQTESQPSWSLLIGFLITVSFVAGGVWIMFAVGESLTREIWDYKLRSMDALRRKLFISEFGLVIFRGLSLTCLILGTVSIANYFGIHWANGYFHLGDPPLHFWSTNIPSLFTLGKGLVNALYVSASFFLFLTPLLKKWFKKTIWVIPVLLIIFAFGGFPMPRIMPISLRWGVNLITGLILSYFIFRYDVLSIVLGMIGVPLLYYGIGALYVQNDFFTIHGLVLLSYFLGLVLLAFFAYRSSMTADEIDPYIPDYMQRISEKERIQRELEIARNVQLTFLPRVTPKLDGLDIASLCLPAKEVGGDYYDFIEIDPKRLGIVIGDVAGKGISAAFYMTLTKGFLKSQAKSSLSPREILININELFYENAERGFFVSMIYAIFDLDSHTLTFSRAGHNPIIVRRSKKGEPEELSPPGIALGLEQGEIFSRTIEERTVGIEKEDLFLFYTDGLNEAQDRSNNEYGERRLMKTVDRFRGETADTVLKRVSEEIRFFTSGAPQHDDMTAVAVKIL